MVLQGFDVTPAIVAEMRTKQQIPVALRNVKLSDQQHEELAQQQELQTEKFRMELMKVVELGEDDPD